MDLSKSILRGDKGIWAIFFILCVISMVEVFSSSIALSQTQGIHLSPIMKHFILLISGLFIVILVHNIPYRWYSVGLILVPISFILLIVVMFWGEERGLSARWLKIFGIQFQPSELAKLAVVIFIAFLLGRMQDTKESKNNTFKVLKYVLAALCLPILYDNFSTAALLFAVSIIMMIIGKIPLVKIGKVLLVVIAGVAVIYFTAPLFTDDSPKEPEKELTEQTDTGVKKVLKRFRGTTWRSRIDQFNDVIHEKAPAEFMKNDKNRQSGYARMAIARGGFSPKLPGNSYIRNFLPEANSDFIYAVIIEELGIAGGVIVIILYLALLIRCGRLVQKSQRKFPAYLLIGCALIITCQAIIHILVCVQLFPVTGQPLPLISKGGTSGWITCVYFGIMLSISRTLIPSEIEKDEEFVKNSEELPENIINKEMIQDIPPIREIINPEIHYKDSFREIDN